jgi:hypothetical protein
VIAIVMVQLMKASSALADEEGLPDRAAGQRDIHALAVQYLDQSLSM